MPLDADVADASAPAGPRYLVLRVGSQRVGVPLEDAREIVPPRSLTRLPGAPAWIAGLVNIRGRVVTVVDLGRRLGADAAAGPIVVVEVAGRSLALRVTAVEAVRAAAGPERAASDAPVIAERYRGTASLPQGETPVLDLPALQRAALADA